jgi:NDP-sugar pyrophosphorylase family protein
LTRTVIVLCGGTGQRFQTESKDTLKPLVEVCGKSQLFWAAKGASLSYRPDNFVFAVRSGLVNRILEEVKSFNFLHGFEVVDVGESTLGPAHTLELALDKSSYLLEDSQMIIVDNDCFNLMELALDSESFPFVTISDSNNPQHCFVQLMNNALVTGFFEKDKKSNTAVSGNYGVINSTLFRKTLSTLISASKSGRETYLSDLMGELLEFQSVKAFQVTEYFSLGTPSEIALLGNEIAKFVED